jgi:TPP-dependent pyruvate/acetoin dehydrogenase alpha subunit
MREADLIRMFRLMVKVRSFEEKCVEMARQGLPPTNPHLAIGQEATIVGVCSALQGTDCVTTTHRGHGHNVAMGAELGPLMAEILGREGGILGGRGGTMHAASFNKGVMGAYPIVGDTLHISTGLALASHYLKQGRVVAGFFGDGAVNAGAFHECLNLASIWKLPVVYVCENNLYAISTPLERVTLVTYVSKKAEAYGIQGVTVNGMDVSDVYEAASRAVENARDGNGPSLIECRTYRFRASSEGEPGNPDKLKYRSKEELEKWMLNDPISTLRSRLTGQKIAEEAELAKIEEEERLQVQEAATYALSSPIPTSG